MLSFVLLSKFMSGSCIQQRHIFTQRHCYREGMRFQSQTIVVVEFGGSGWVCSDVALVGDEGREEEQLHLRQLFANAASLTHGEEEHFAGQILVQSSALVQETLGFKGLWMGPYGWVVIVGPLADEDDCVFWYGVAHDGGVRGGGVGDGERHKACEAHHLVDEGHDVRQLDLVLDGRESAAVYHLIHLLLETCLHLRIPTFTGDTHVLKLMP